MTDRITQYQSGDMNTNDVMTKLATCRSVAKLGILMRAWQCTNAVALAHVYPPEQLVAFIKKADADARNVERMTIREARKFMRENGWIL